MSQRVLVTGSEGFTGKYVCDEFARAGWEVWGAGVASQPDKPRYLQIDLLKPDTLVQICAIARPNVVIHLAAIAFVEERNPSIFYQVNLIGTRHLLDALSRAEHPPECTILASSANVYGNSDLAVLSEDSPVNPANDYAVSKLAMEYMAKTYMDRLGIVITRPFNYTGRGQAEHFLIPKIIAHFVRKERRIGLGNIDIFRDFSDVRDIARYYRRVSERQPLGTTINFCSGMACSLTSIIEQAQRVSGHSLKVQSMPEFSRKNEVHTLTGSNAMLVNFLGEEASYSNEDTIAWMLDEDLRRPVN